MPPPMIPDAVLNGAYVRLRPLIVDDAEIVYSVLVQARPDLWTYMPFGPFYSADDASEYFRYMLDQSDWRPYIIEVDGLVQGFMSYMRINPPDGVIEIGSIVFSPQLQRTTAATESVYLMMRHAFDSGYRQRNAWDFVMRERSSTPPITRVGAVIRRGLRSPPRSGLTAVKGLNRGSTPPISTRTETNSARCRLSTYPTADPPIPTHMAAHIAGYGRTQFRCCCGGLGFGFGGDVRSVHRSLFFVP